METKICTKCGRELPATEEYFYKKSAKKDGLKAYCKDCSKKYHKEWAKNHKDERKEYQTQYKKEWRSSEENKEYENKIRRQHYKTHKKEFAEYFKQKYIKEKQNGNYDKYVMNAQKRLAIKRKLKSTLTLKQWKQIKIKFNNKCAYCGEELPLQQEHFIPLSKGGEYTIHNIIPACRSCNCSKNNKDFFEWYPKQDFYSKEREDFILNHLGYDEDKQLEAI